MLDHVLRLLADREVASIAPTSRKCVHEICRSIDFSVAKVIVEYGPGDGAFTKHLLSKMHASARLIVIETNQHFVDHLRSTCHDRRLQIVHRDASEVRSILNNRNISEVDYVLSGIPFSFLSERTKDRLLRDTALLIKPTGKFLVYQSLTAPNGRRLLVKNLKRYFAIESTYNLYLNLPPLYVLESAKLAVSNQNHFTLPARNDSQPERSRDAFPITSAIQRAAN